MTVGTSSDPGYIAPLAPLPTEDDPLDAQLQAAVVGITGLGDNLVRPRWQTIPPQQPPRATDWCAIGVANIKADTYAATVHDPNGAGGLGTSDEQRHETIEAMASFYGPNAKGFAALLRDGFGVSQNREVLRSQGLAFVATERLTMVPDLVNNEWIHHVDVVFTMRRGVARTFPIQNILSVDGSIAAENGSAAGGILTTTPFSQAG